jgi:hypothetical protein
MRQSLGAIIAVSLLGAGCAASLQETKMYNGPFGRTEVGAIMIAADPASSKVLVETYDGDLWIYDVDATARGRLSGLRVGDEVILAFDDRIAGKRAIAVNVVASGRRPLPAGMLTVADILPYGVVFGAPAVSPAYAGGTGGIPVAGGLAYNPGMVVVGANGVVFSANGTIVGANGTVFGTNGTIVGTLGPNGTIFGSNGTPVGTLGPNGTMVGTNGTVTGTLGPNGTIVGTNRPAASADGTFGNANGTTIDSSGNVIAPNGAIVGALGANGTIIGANGAVIGNLGPNGGVTIANGAFTGTAGATSLTNTNTNLTNRTTIDANGNVVAANGSIIGTLGPNRAVVGADGQVLGTLGPNGTIIGTNGNPVGVGPTTVAFNNSLGSLGPEANNVGFTSAGAVIVPGFGSFSGLSAGLVSPQTALGLGLSTGAVLTAPVPPMGGPAVATATGVPNPGRSAITSGNFTPGTVAPESAP